MSGNTEPDDYHRQYVERAGARSAAEPGECGRGPALIGEDHESRLIEKVISTVTPVAEKSFRAFLPDCYVDCLKIALTETIPIEERRSQITTILQREIAQPLAIHLNENCDARFIPERLEAKMFKVIAEKLVEEMVEWCVGEIDDRLQQSLNKSREQAQSQE